SVPSSHSPTCSIRSGMDRTDSSGTEDEQPEGASSKPTPPRRPADPPNPPSSSSDNKSDSGAPKPLVPARPVQATPKAAKSAQPRVGGQAQSQGGKSAQPRVGGQAQSQGGKSAQPRVGGQAQSQGGKQARPPLRKPPVKAVARRSFLKTASIATGVAALAGAAGAGGWYEYLRNKKTGPSPNANVADPTSTTQPGVFSTQMNNGMSLPTAAWVARENSLVGTTNWMVADKPIDHAIEGYANLTSATVGQSVTLYVNTIAPTFHVEAYRLGWYGGTGGRLIWTSPETTGTRQPPSVFTPGINMVECHWAPSMNVTIEPNWPPGVYLLKLVASDGQQQFIPLTIRDDNSTAAFVVMNSVTTWQAYNLWGGYSLYYGQSGSGQEYATRSRVVSFDRPYPLDWANGAADLIGNELPLILLMEKAGLDVTYWTDIDLHLDQSSSLARHSALISLGHDEYWSTQMRQNATAARDAGVNLVFFGANACFRRIRFASSPIGPNRHQICYKDAAEDPVYGTNNAEITANWPDSPDPNPEGSLIGDMYQSNPVDANLIVTNPNSWLYNGVPVTEGQSIKSVVGSEYDRCDPSSGSPANIEILAHSPLVCRGISDHSDVTWYTAPSGAGVFATGTNWWISKLVTNSLIPPQLLPGPFPGVTELITPMTMNVLSAVGNGPAGKSYPSQANWQNYYSAAKSTTGTTISPGI
ncbi:MAG TPA: N,N-dimethylformamidase beta subunit family domain-containing protein, partial [Acidimicrobiales bacterium]|nr:N,N-dimethylformamidase beta subunit family domain-containing protein [Acidimicrobiales bacterium]